MTRFAAIGAMGTVAAALPQTDTCAGEKGVKGRVLPVRVVRTVTTAALAVRATRPAIRGTTQRKTWIATP
jgi:hypothetical protein